MNPNTKYPTLLLDTGWKPLHVGRCYFHGTRTVKFAPGTDSATIDAFIEAVRRSWSGQRCDVQKRDELLVTFDAIRDSGD